MGSQTRSLSDWVGAGRSQMEGLGCRHGVESEIPPHPPTGVPTLIIHYGSTAVTVEVGFLGNLEVGAAVDDLLKTLTKRRLLISPCGESWRKLFSPFLEIQPLPSSCLRSMWF